MSISDLTFNFNHNQYLIENSHSELNPKLWKNNELISEVRDKLIEIANEFIDNFSIELSVDDINIIGSNARI